MHIPLFLTSKSWKEHWSKWPAYKRLGLLSGLLIVALLGLYYSGDEPPPPEGNPIALDIVRPFYGTSIHFVSVERNLKGEVILHGRIVDFSKVPVTGSEILWAGVSGYGREDEPASNVIEGDIPFVPDPKDPKARIVDIPLASSPLSAPWLNWNLSINLATPQNRSIHDASLDPQHADFRLSLRTPNPGRSSTNRNFPESQTRQKSEGVEFTLDDFSDTETVNYPHRFSSSTLPGTWPEFRVDLWELKQAVSDWWRYGNETSINWRGSLKVGASEPGWHSICATAAPNLESPNPYLPTFPLYWPEDGPYQIRALMVHFKVFSVSEILALPAPPSGSGITTLHRSISWNGTHVELEALTWDGGKPSELRLHFRAGALFCAAKNTLMPAQQSTEGDHLLDPFYHQEFQTDELGDRFGYYSGAPISQVVRSSAGPSDTMATFDLVPYGDKPISEINLYVVDRAEVATFYAQPRINR